MIFRVNDYIMFLCLKKNDSSKLQAAINILEFFFSNTNLLFVLWAWNELQLQFTSYENLFDKYFTIKSKDFNN